MGAADGEAWAYECIIGALPRLDLRPWTAEALRLVGFEAAVPALVWYYDP